MTSMPVIADNTSAGQQMTSGYYIRQLLLLCKHYYYFIDCSGLSLLAAVQYKN